METTLTWLQRQGHLLTALLEQAERALSAGDRERAEDAIGAFAARLLQRIERAEGSVFPFIERRVQDSEWGPLHRLREQHSALLLTLRRVVELLDEQCPATGEALHALEALLQAHLDEEQRVVWPLASLQPA